MAFLNRRTELIWQCMKLYLPPNTELTSVYRSGQHQLDMIIERARQKGYKFKTKPTLDNESSWIDAWKLVNTKLNPIAKPNRSTHQKGLAYDLSGPELSKIIEGVETAASDGAIHLLPARPGWSNPRLEGHCVHVEIDAGQLGFEPFGYV